MAASAGSATAPVPVADGKTAGGKTATGKTAATPTSSAGTRTVVTETCAVYFSTRDSARLTRARCYLLRYGFVIDKFDFEPKDIRYRVHASRQATDCAEQTFQVLKAIFTTNEDPCHLVVIANS